MSAQYYRPNNLPPVVKNLLILNVLVFIAQVTLDKQYQITEMLMLYPVKFSEFRPYQIFTHMFAHSPNEYFHIIFNMFALWMFGRILENVWGPKRFLFFYLVCGVGAAACHLLIQDLRYDPVLMQQLNDAIVSGDRGAEISLSQQVSAFASPVLGASGAIMGLFAAFGYLFPNTELFIMFIPIPVKAKWAVLGLAAIDLFGGVANYDNVAHFAHLGGAITGFIIVLIWNKTNRKTLY